MSCESYGSVKRMPGCALYRPAARALPTQNPGGVVWYSRLSQLWPAFNAFRPTPARSTRFPYKAQAAPNTPAAPEVKLTLKGILGSVGTRLALINNQTFSEGESGPVKVPGGQIRIRCIKINDHSALISVEGKNEQIELRLQDK